MDFIKFLNHFQPISKSSQQASVYKSFKLNLKPNILNEKDENSSSFQEQKTDVAQTMLQRLEDEKVFNQKVSDKVKKAERGMTTIYFRDPITNKLVRSALSSTAINKMGIEFDKEDMTKRLDGSYILSGKAENFVAGWYADIAYTRAYVASDRNNDGYLEDYELEDTKSGFVAQETNLGLFVQSYTQLNGSVDTLFGFEKDFREMRPDDTKDIDYAGRTIGLELDKMIRKDGDFNGELSFSETGMQAVKTKAPNSGWTESVGMLTLTKFNQTNTIEIKDILDKLGKGVKYDDLSEDEKSLLKMQLSDKIFDEVEDKETGGKKLVFNPDKFKIFYEGFVDLFKQRSAKMLGLKPEDATKLNYDNLGEIVNEMKQTYFDTNSTSYGKISDLIKIWA
ncbi:hypothetical protein ACU512_001673 [Campylobacter jejuni]|uniref:Uncharacterized protein n=1 Tax=Campylobacter jejuni TaxID=197 RepID=A0AAX0NIV2_CAMJU|nr:hypothetical protein [Campylobacter jejuni]EAJ8917360.1 hypothetical protein [Campylobacter jejuni]EAL4710193.1 hypothetical protein [Campylobacter jejuni]EAM0922905.1 hypothetical protein [Campylobacter jejuni]ECO7024138.1 hypothetical protein [Campylobacter jejuni]ECP6146522.1 hypothetical protein [Campylobacter jejuni]